MPTATLTWSENHGNSNPLSTFSLNVQGAIQLLNQYFTALSAFSDFPWEVCSFEGTTAPWFVTLKRKSGAPGRIVFIGVTAAPGATYNPQLGNISWSTAGIRGGWFKDATTDTPANILATSGDVFTGAAGGEGLCPNYNSFTTGTNVFTAWANEDGVFLRYGPIASTLRHWVLGNMLEDDVGDAGAVAFSGLLLSGITPSTNPTIGGDGALRIDGANTLHFGSGWTVTGSPYPLLRDDGLKRAWYLPISLACFELPPAEMYKYKFRQIALGPTPLAGFERLVTTGDVLAAMSTHPATAENYPWLTNFKV